MKRITKVARGDASRRFKRKQALKLKEIHRALVAAKFDTLDKQAAVLTLGRSTAWALLHSDKKVGPSNRILQHILAAPQLPPKVRLKVNEYIRAKSRGQYGHSDFIIRTCVHDFNAASTSLRNGTSPPAPPTAEEIAPSTLARATSATIVHLLSATLTK